MTGIQLFVLIAVFFATSGVSVVTGSTSIITVPVMFQVGMDARVAVATNMFALTFMSLGGSLPFLPPSAAARRRLPVLIVLTLIGSAMGAFLLMVTPSKIVPLIVSIAVIGVAIFSTLYRRSGVDPSGVVPSQSLEVTGCILTFVLGIYGGLFSGGYVTLLTALFVAMFRMTFIEAVAITKLINVFSSGVATVIFMRRGLVDYRLGAILGATMFVSAILGARFARRLGNLWIRRIYFAAVWLLGLKTLLFDIFGSGPGLMKRPTTP
ncbi:MAG TPA: sulfite exporter TauE/SafE family protein [Bryobacteraceae bacterium]